MLKRLLYLVLLALAATAPAFGQSTTVSGQVTDAGSQAWKNGSYVFTFVPNPQYPVGPYTWTGGALNTTISGSLNGSGAYSVSVPSSTAITPQGSTWVLQVVPNATSPAYTTTSTTITGGTQTLNVTPPAIAISLSAPLGQFTAAYADAEISSAVLGAFYFNVTSLATRTCTVLSGSTCATYGTTRPATLRPGSSSTLICSEMRLASTSKS